MQPAERRLRCPISLMGDIRALTWRIIFAHLLLQTTFGLFIKIGGPLQRERNDTKKLQMILIIWIGLLLQSGWSSAIFFAKGPEILEIVMTKAILV